MSQAVNPYAAANFEVAAMAAENERASFITKTYLHLVGAIGAFILVEAVLLNSPLAPKMMEMLGRSQYGWLMVMGGFMVVSWVANSWALSAVSLSKQYLGLSLYVVGEAIVFLPLLYMAKLSKPEAIPAAAITTLGLFGILTLVVFITRKDFSFLRSILLFGGIAACGLIVCAIVFGFELGPIFTYAMIALACGYILYSTSNVMHHYRTTQYVAAALALFAAVAMMFWYILRLFMSRD